MAEPEIYQFRLTKNYQAFVKDLEPRKVLGYLFQDDIIDEDDMEEVRSERTRKRQAEALLNLLSRRIEGYEVLFRALKETQPHLASILQTPVIGESLKIGANCKRKVDSADAQCTEPATVDEFTRMINVLSVGRPSENDIHLHFDEHVQPDSKATDCSSTRNQPDENDSYIQPTQSVLLPPHMNPLSKDSINYMYKIRSSPRGLAVIVNMNEFFPLPEYSGEKLDDRDGSEVDAEGLEKLFKELNFITERLTDLPKDKLEKELLLMSKYDFSKYDCFVLCIMSHGKDDYFYASDGGKVKVKSVRDKFNSVNCGTLCGKPKLFFIQACRGTTKDFGTSVRDGPTRGPSENEELTGPQFKFNLPSEPKPSTSSNADFLLAYSSVDGHTSYRNTSTGSRFVRYLIEVFREYSGQEDVLSMMTMVNKKVNEHGAVGDKQIPQPQTTLTKKVYFCLDGSS